MTSNHPNVEGGTFKKIPLETVTQKYNILELCEKKMNKNIVDMLRERLRIMLENDEEISIGIILVFVLLFVNYRFFQF